MSISIPRLLRRTTLPFLAILVLLLPYAALAQPAENRDIARLNRRLKSLVNTFDGLRWSNVTIYRVGDEYKQRILKFLSEADEPDKLRLCAIVNGWLDEEKPCSEIFDKVNNAAKRADPNRNFARFKQLLGQQLDGLDLEGYEEQEIRDAATLATSISQRVTGRPDNFYLVTSRGGTRPRLIAMLGVKGDEATGNIRIASDAFVWAGGDLYDNLRLNSADTGMYEELKEAVAEKNGQIVVNRTFALRSFDSIEIAPRTTLKAQYLEEGQYDWVLTGVSEGRPLRGEAKPDDTSSSDGASSPFDFGSLVDAPASGSKVAGAIVPGTGEYPYELAVGTDVIVSFRNYKIVNKNQPRLKWGVELRSNFDEINYPSIWGGRMTLNAVLENIKIGAVLPQLRFGGNSLDSSGFGDSHQPIIGGFGAAISGDFDAPMLSNSGLFNFYGSYTFGETMAKSLRATKFDSLNSITQAGDVGYLIRYAAQAYYSFGFFADLRAEHLFRVKIGGGVYGVDMYRRRLDPKAPAEDTTTFIMDKDLFGSSSHGGVGGKIEYMRGGTKYPFGIGFQYFDQSILGNIWLQFSVSQRWDLKFEGKYFTPLFRDPHAWENKNLVVPSVTVKYHFGQVTPGS